MRETYFFREPKVRTVEAPLFQMSLFVLRYRSQRLYSDLQVFFVNYFSKPEFANFPVIGIVLMKLAFAMSLACLFLSLAAGLLHLKRNEMFWEDIMKQRYLGYKAWNRVVRREISFKEGLAHRDGSARGDGTVIPTPKWTWILQSTFLGFGLFILIVLATVFLFGAKPVAVENSKNAIIETGLTVTE